MSSTPDPPRQAKSARMPPSFFYDRVVPALLAVMGIVLVIVILLVVGALAGIIPIK